MCKSSKHTSLSHSQHSRQRISLDRIISRNIVGVLIPSVDKHKTQLLKFDRLLKIDDNIKSQASIRTLSHWGK
jgi:hypothetical protein